MIIKKIITKNGQKISLGKFNVLVGSNNVGKSQTLIDIHKIMTSDRGSMPNTERENKIIVETIHSKPKKFDDLLFALNVTPEKNIDENDKDDYITVKGISSDFNDTKIIQRVNLSEIKRKFNEKNSNFNFDILSLFKIAYLDLEKRLEVFKPKEVIDPDPNMPQNILQVLFTAKYHKDLRFEYFKNAFRNTFGMDLEVENTYKVLQLRIGKNIGILSDEKKFRKELKKHELFNTQGHGYRSFAAILASILFSENKAILIDEPELSLHPQQARELGAWITRHYRKTKGQLIISTHSSHFLAGLLSKNSRWIKIIRLNRKSNYTNFKTISSKAVSKLTSDPLLSSQRVQEAIFYFGIVVCEGDKDRIIYQTVASRIYNNENLLFIQAHSKHVIKDIIELLRSASVPVCAIVDIDILNSEKNLRELLESFTNENLSDLLAKRKRVEELIGEINEKTVYQNICKEIKVLSDEVKNKKYNLTTIKSRLKNILENNKSKWSIIKKNGIESKDLSENAKKIINLIINKVKDYKIFIVPAGNLEGWGKNIIGQDPWIINMLKKIHNKTCNKNLKKFVKEIIKIMNEDTKNSIQ